MASGNPGSLDLPAQTSITLAGWFKQETMTDNALYMYAICLGYNTSEPICTIGFLDDGTIVSYIETDWGDSIGTSNQDQVNVYSPAGAIEYGENFAFTAWHHVAVVHDRSTDIGTIYLDGQALDCSSKDAKSGTTHDDGSIATLSDSHAFSFDTRDSKDSTKTGPGSVGYYTSTSANFRGRLDDLRVYTHALTAGEVKALVPEPSTLVLLSLLALCGLGVRRRS